MKHVLRDYIGHFVVVYFDKILVCSQSLDEHIGHLKQVLIILREYHLFANLEKNALFTRNMSLFFGIQDWE